MGFYSVFSALYAQDISKKIATAKENQMKQGIPCSMVPYGYRVERDAENEKVMVSDEEPARIVKRIFEEVAAGKSQTEVARDLNKEEIPTPYQYRMRKQPEKLAEKPHLRWNRDHIAVIGFHGKRGSGADSVNILSKLIDRVYIYGDDNLQVVFKNDDYFQAVCVEGIEEDMCLSFYGT